MIEIMAVAGNGGNAARWAQLPTPLATDVIFTPLILPGFDRRPLEVPQPTIEDFGRWLAEEIEQLRTKATVVLLGTGIGGSIAFQTAQQAGVVDGYIFHAPVGPSLDTRLLPRLMKPPIVRKVTKAAIGGPAGRVLLRRRFGNALSREAIDRFAQGYLDCDAFEVLWDVLTAEWFDSLKPIVEPSVLIWGANDGVLAADHADGFETLLPNAKVVVEESWAHYPMLERPDHFATTVAALARQLVGATA